MTDAAEKSASPLEAIESRRAKRREDTEKARLVQYEIDMVALDKLEDEHGENLVKALHVSEFIKGQPTFVVVKSPSGTSFHKRFCDRIRAAKGSKNEPRLSAEAQDELAKACIVYPIEGALASMVEAFPGILNNAAAVAVEFVGVKAEEEKKG